MTFRSVGAALRWYARATAQADGLKAVDIDPDTIRQAHGMAPDQEARLLAIWAIGDALRLLAPSDRRLIIAVRVYDQLPEYAISAERRSVQTLETIAIWRLHAAERIVGGRLQREGLLDADPEHVG